MAEGEFSVLQRQCLDRRIPNPETLQREVNAWQQHRNASAVGANWQFTAEGARIKLGRLYPSFSASFRATLSPAEVETVKLPARSPNLSRTQSVLFVR